MGASGPPGGVSKSTKCDRNEGAVGDWFLLRGLTDADADRSGE